MKNLLSGYGGSDYVGSDGQDRDRGVIAKGRERDKDLIGPGFRSERINNHHSGPG